MSDTLKNNKMAFTSYYDVPKTFYGVWMNGLFFKLNEIGIKGKLCWILFRTYKDFRCRVRSHGLVSNWCQMPCGIHQGFYHC